MAAHVILRRTTLISKQSSRLQQTLVKIGIGPHSDVKEDLTLGGWIL
jgi:hypothetical protein